MNRRAFLSVVVGAAVAPAANLDREPAALAPEYIAEARVASMRVCPDGQATGCPVCEYIAKTQWGQRGYRS